jgi:uridine kinase
MNKAHWLCLPFTGVTVLNSVLTTLTLSLSDSFVSVVSDSLITSSKGNQMEIENEIDINEVEDININALTPKQKALRLNALVKLAQGSVFTNHDFEEALTLTRQLMKR